jgi:hypothetical protein
VGGPGKEADPGAEPPDKQSVHVQQVVQSRRRQREEKEMTTASLPLNFSDWPSLNALFLMEMEHNRLLSNSIHRREAQKLPHSSMK